MDIEDLKDIECHAIPGAGACGIYTAALYLWQQI